ncbi:MAG: diaminopimelate decarboxylase, partial [Verrucomicrobiales bacterium]
NRSGTNAYIISGHCCESGDMLTPSPDDPEQLLPRELAEARIGDVLVIDGAGAYCSAMCAKNYNSFPETAEVLVEANDGFRLIRKPQTLDQILANEV